MTNQNNKPRCGRYLATYNDGLTVDGQVQAIFRLHRMDEEGGKELLAKRRLAYETVPWGSEILAQWEDMLFLLREREEAVDAT